MTRARDPFQHILAMSDRTGTFEHAAYTEPRRAGGYCTDDVARVLIAVVREPKPTAPVVELGRTALRFLADAQGVNGRVHNRRREGGRWTDLRAANDAWGRSVWAFGSAACRASDPGMRQSALAYFEHGVEQRSPWPRAMAFAALGAAEVMAAHPDHDAARRVLVDAIATIGPARDDEAWPWPAPRLEYSNAALAEALIAAGSAVGDQRALADGLSLLRWLLERETIAGHLSPTPVGGSGPGDGRGFDQQPIEVAAMADACARAAAITGDPVWLDGLRRAIAWFDGDNDAGVVMWDLETGGGYDGLETDGANLNQGAESTLALIATRQLRPLLVPAPA
jgi:hypothetical protein